MDDKAKNLQRKCSKITDLLFIDAKKTESPDVAVEAEDGSDNRIIHGKEVPVFCQGLIPWFYPVYPIVPPSQKIKFDHAHSIDFLVFRKAPVKNRLFFLTDGAGENG
jgi:hypothetical protein